MKSTLRAYVVASLFVGWLSPAIAQPPSSYLLPNGANPSITYQFGAFNCGLFLCSGSVPVDASGNTLSATPGTATSSAMTVQGISGGTPIPVTGTFSATLSGFEPAGVYATLSVTTSSSRVALPSDQSVVVVYNNGSQQASVLLGGSGVVALETNDQVPAGGWMAFAVGSNTYIAAVTSTGSTSLVISGGSGLPTGAGGGSGGGGGTVTQGSNGSTSSAWYVQPGGGATFPATESGTWNVGLNAGSNTIGAISNTSFAATQSGSWSVGQSGAPWSQNVTQWDGAALGAPSNYGTSPGAVAVPGVNAFVTNTPNVAQSGTWNVGLSAGSNTIGAVTQASGPWTVNLTQLDGSALGAPSNYGTSPGAVAVQGVNAFITNTPAVTQSGTWNVGLSAGSNTIGAISNASFAATQSGTWTVQPGNTANTTAWLVTGTGGTFPATQSGTWTVNPTTIGNWGLAASTQNGTAPTNGGLVMGQFNTTPTTITSGNISPLQMDNAGNLLVNVKAGGGSGGTSSSFSATFPSTGTAAGAEYLSSAPTLTSGQMVALQTDVNGNLKVNVSAGGGSGGTSSTFGAAFPSTGTAIGLTNGTDMVAWSATSNYGTAPGTIAVPAVNAAVTNTVTVTATDLSTNVAQFGGTTVVTGGVNGSQGVGGLAAAGSAVSGNPILLGVTDGTDARAALGDTSGRQIMIGAAAAGSAVAGNPVLIGGSDGTDARTASTDSSGHFIIEPGNTANTTAWLVTGAGGTFPVTQATAANLNATVVGTGTFAVQAAQTGTWAQNITEVAGSTSGVTTWGTAPTGASVLNANVNCLSGCSGSGGTSSSFNATFPSTGTAAGAEYLSSAPSLTSGQMVALQVTSAGSLHTTIDNANTNGPATAANSSPVTSANPPVGAANIATNQISVGSSATSIVGARTGVSGTGRVSVTVTNTSTTPVYIGGSGVTTSTGTLLPGIVGASATLNTTAAVYGIVTTGTETVSYVETY